jgi:hypothetical protein
MADPKLRTVTKVKPPYPLNKFPSDFPYKFGREIILKLATGQTTIEGPEWERIFALAIGGTWKPSNVGLDDITLGTFAWGAKSVKHASPAGATSVRLISGRNSPSYSFDNHDLSAKADVIGKLVLEIWNGRVESLRNTFSGLRTVVLVKSDDLTKFMIFEFDTVMYPPDRYSWKRNKNNNLEGYELKTGLHKFTWQPHGSQFTIIENVSTKRLCISVKKPAALDAEVLLESIGFDKSWIKVS